MQLHIVSILVHPILKKLQAHRIVQIIAISIIKHLTDFFVQALCYQLHFTLFVDQSGIYTILI